jgi:hypothetical protein
MKALQSGVQAVMGRRSAAKRSPAFSDSDHCVHQDKSSILLLERKRRELGPLGVGCKECGETGSAHHNHVALKNGFESAKIVKVNLNNKTKKKDRKPLNSHYRQINEPD